MKRLVCVALAAFAIFASTWAALAAGPVDYQTGFQPAASEMMQKITDFQDMTFWIILVITVFVFGLLLVVIFKFNAKANPVPSKTSHNTAIEIAWTVIPILILVVITIPSFRILKEQLNFPTADMTIKVIGSQWTWDVEYPDHDDIALSVFMLKDETDDGSPTRLDLKPNEPRLLAVDNNVVVPIGKTVRVIVTATDVIHSFAMPVFGLKIDAIPGRLNETWFKAEREGIYYGQCSELCGRDHAFMPIVIQVVSQDMFAKWAAAAVDDVDEANLLLASLIENEKKLKVASR
ncbi:MAG: cytochrome c oxidase subunit II [Cohaesibacteraceae bacterium]|nr:cytochrome c oxidase subunit II [Cohaesibacteraceae bacterium]